MDIKPSNFVFVRGQLKASKHKHPSKLLTPLCVQVIDLGCAEMIPDDSDRVLSCVSKGTEGYMPPECFNADTRKRFTYTVRFIKQSRFVILLSIKECYFIGQIPILSGFSSFICQAK